MNARSVAMVLAVMSTFSCSLLLSEQTDALNDAGPSDGADADASDRCDCGADFCVPETGECIQTAAAVFISPAGSDSQECTFNFACRTLNRAFVAAATMSRQAIVALPGNYPATSATKNAPGQIRLVAYRATFTTQDAAAGRAITTLFGLDIEGATFAAFPGRIDARGITIQGDTTVTVNRSKFMGFDRGVFLDDEGSQTTQALTVSATRFEGCLVAILSSQFVNASLEIESAFVVDADIGLSVSGTSTLAIRFSTFDAVVNTAIQCLGSVTATVNSTLVVASGNPPSCPGATFTYSHFVGINGSTNFAMLPGLDSALVPQQGSPAHDVAALEPPELSDVDARGLSRPVGDPDVGAFERQPNENTFTGARR